MLVSQILKSKATQHIVTIPPSADVSAAAEMLSIKRIGSVVVSDDGKTASGILSERDIVREMARSGASCLDQSVSEIMTCNLVTCGLTTQADDLLSQMTEGRFRHMPVVEDGALVGIVSLGDVVKTRLSEVSMEKTALEGMIMGH